jgi:hypothetical protein
MHFTTYTLKKKPQPLDRSLTVTDQALRQSRNDDTFKIIGIREP